MKNLDDKCIDKPIRCPSGFEIKDGECVVPEQSPCNPSQKIDLNGECQDIPLANFCFTG